MEKKPPRPMTPFDELVIPQQLHMLKLMLPYTPASNRQFLGVFIKFLELKETIAFFRDFGNDLHSQAFTSSSPPSPMEMLSELKPYMPPQEAEMMDTFLNMMNIMEMVQMFQGNGSQGTGSMADMFSGKMGPMDLMMGMLTPEQQNMFQMYSSMFSNETDTQEKEDNSDNPENGSDLSSSDLGDLAAYAQDTSNQTMKGPEAEGSKSEYPDTDIPAMKGENIYERMDEQPGNEKYRPGQIRTDSNGSIPD